MDLATHYANRQEIPADELAKHRGKWVAFSAQGDRVMASSEDLEFLRQELLGTGEDPNEVVLTHLPADVEGMLLGGLEIE
jgi:hypothetical protein